MTREGGVEKMMVRFERHEQWQVMRLCWSGRDVNDDEVGKVLGR
jgi:hypothetical protein